MFCKELKMMAMTMSLVLLQIFGASSVLVASEAQGERNTGNFPSIDQMTEGMHAYRSAPSVSTGTCRPPLYENAPSTARRHNNDRKQL